MNAHIVSPEERDMLRRTYEAVQNVSETARRHGRSLRTVTRHLRHAGVDIKPRRLDIDEQRIVDLYQEGLSLRAIAAKVRVSYGTAHRVVSQAGVMRRRGNSGARAASRQAAVPVPVPDAAGDGDGETAGHGTGAGPYGAPVQVPTTPSPQKSAVSGGTADAPPPAT